MRLDLSSQLPTAGERSGSVTGPGGVVCVRTSDRLARRDLDDMVASKADFPIILEKAALRRLEWYDGEDAVRVWRRVRPHVGVREPTSSLLAKHERWVAQLWRSHVGDVVIYLVGRP